MGPVIAAILFGAFFYIFCFTPEWARVGRHAKGYRW
jgi:hypothetical protein